MSRGRDVKQKLFLSREEKSHMIFGPNEKFHMDKGEIESELVIDQSHYMYFVLVENVTSNSLTQVCVIEVWVKDGTGAKFPLSSSQGKH